MEWTRPEVVSVLALLVSGLSLGVAFLSFWRSYLAQQPLAWLEVQTTQIPNEWLATIHLRNRSPFDWRAVHAMVPLTKFPLTDKQDFLLGKVLSAPFESERGNRSLTATFNLKASLHGTVLAGESGLFSVVLRRGPLSDATVVTIAFVIQSMVAKPRCKTLTIKADLPRPSLTMVLG